MVWGWAVVLAWLGAVPGVWCLPLDSSLHPYSVLARDLAQSDPDALPLTYRLYNAADVDMTSLPTSPPSGDIPVVYAVPDVVADDDGARLEDKAPLVDPRLWHYFKDTKRDAATSEKDALNNILGLVSSGSNNVSSGVSLKDIRKVKKNWPYGVSRRRASGLSLSIDASMKVLREALYLEIARKKQRQQLQRARENQELLTIIGKRGSQPADQHTQHRD